MTSEQTQKAGNWPDPPIPDVDSNGFMHPPWEKFPNIPRNSIGWRMGVGEQYLEEFSIWWSRQDRAKKLAVRALYSEPSAWTGFWRSLSGA